MTPAAIIRKAAADGVSLALSPSGTLKATGEQAAGLRPMSRAAAAIDIPIGALYVLPSCSAEGAQSRKY